MIRIQGENVIIHGKETLLYGGELHYFRIPQSEWKNRLKQLKEAGLNMVSTYVPWKFHEMEEGNIDLTGRTRPERDLKKFLELVEEEGLYCLVRPGPYVMAEVVDHGVPTWFIDHYPEAVAKTRDEQNHPTRVVSYMHPVFLEKTKKWYEAVCEIIRPFQITNGSGPVIFFQLDNEVGMFHWVTNTPDFNPQTLKLFEDYLKNRYSKEEFENTFHASYDELSYLAENQVKQPDEAHAHALRNEFSLFLRQHYREFIEYLKGLADENGIQVPYVVNIHGFHTIDLLKRGTMYPIGISQLLEAAKIENVLMAGDYYIGNIEYDNYIDIVLANAFTRSIQWKEQPLFSAEFQGGSIHDKPRLQPTTFDLTTRLCVADGMNGVNFYMFVSGENYENIGIHGKRHDWQAPLTATGEKRPHYQLIQHLGKMFKVYEQQLSDTKPEVDTSFAFYPDYFMTDFYDDHTKDMIESIKGEREAFMYNGIAKGLRANNYVFDAINLLNDENLNAEQNPTLWVFATKWMDKNIQQKLVDYMENGGTVILFPTIPERTMKNEPCTLLKDYIDVEIKETTYGGFATIGSLDNVSVHKVERYLVNAEAFAWMEDDSKDPVAFEKSLGKGKIIVFGLGFELDFEYKRNIITDLANRAGIQSRFKLEEELDITIRKNSDGREFIFVNNFDEYTKKTVLGYKENLLFAGKQLVVPPKTGLMLPRNVQILEDLKVVSGTGEIFDLITDEDKISMTIRVIQKEEEFVFQSSSWKPFTESDDTLVEQLSDDLFKIRIKSYEDTAQIQFFTHSS